MESCNPDAGVVRHRAGQGPRAANGALLAAHEQLEEERPGLLFMRWEDQMPPGVPEPASWHTDDCIKWSGWTNSGGCGARAAGKGQAMQRCCCITSRTLSSTVPQLTIVH